MYNGIVRRFIGGRYSNEKAKAGRASTATTFINDPLDPDSGFRTRGVIHYKSIDGFDVHLVKSIFPFRSDPLGGVLTPFWPGEIIIGRQGERGGDEAGQKGAARV